MANKKVKKVKEEEIKKIEEIEEEEEIESPLKEGLSDKTRVIIIGTVVIAMVALIVGLLIVGGKDETVPKRTNGSSGSENHTIANEFDKYWNASTPTLIVFASSQCGWCHYQEPIVKKIGEYYNLDYLFMDVLSYSESERAEIVERLGISGATPTSVIVKDGKVLLVMEGFRDTTEYTKFLVQGGVLPEGTVYEGEKNFKQIGYSEFKKLVNGKTASVVLFDQGTCGDNCLEQREHVNNVVGEYKLPAYHFSADSLESNEEQKELVENFGKWGYDTDEYKTEQSISIPLLMVVKNGKFVSYDMGVMSEDQIKEFFKKAGLIK